MSVTSSTIQGAEWSGEGDETYRDTISATWRVETDSAADGPITVYNGALSSSPHPVPPRGNPYSIGNDFSAFLVAKTFSVKPAGKSSHSMLWDIVVNFGPLDKQEPGDDNPVPTERPVKWGASYESYDKYVVADRAGVKILNHAGHEHNPPAKRTKHEILLTARQNITSLPVIISRCQTMFGSTGLGAKNSAEWNGVGTGKALFVGPTIGDLESVNGIFYYPVTWRFRVSETAFVLSLVERGLMVLDQAGGQPTRPKDPFHPGAFLPGPYLLNTNGTYRANTNIALTTDWEVHEAVNFATTLGF